MQCITMLSNEVSNLLNHGDIRDGLTTKNGLMTCGVNAADLCKINYFCCFIPGLLRAKCILLFRGRKVITVGLL